MSEYIITCDDEVAMWVGNEVETMKRIVRCRDCEHWQPWMKGAEPECWANGEPFKTPSEGFCAWAERRSE